MDWETLSSETRPSENLARSLVERSPIFEGWLIRYTHYDYSGDLYVVGVLTFVPDPKHEWDGLPPVELLKEIEIADRSRG